ncbi:MAG TPA: hypothetical protein VEA41_13350 [Salinarimonas sp.]|nr:hypothetical protein [Salinarimonas sp.]
MWAGREAPQPGLRVATREEAGRLVAEVLDGLAQLEKLVEVETANLRAGRIREALSEQERKAELSGLYLRGLEAVKANAVALARFVPGDVERLKAAHASFGRAIEVNQVVLPTARAVSESLVRGIAEEMNRASAPQGYGSPAGYAAGRPPAGQPLVLSKRL